MTKTIIMPMAAKAVPLSEDWLALHFIDKHQRIFRWSPGVDWMYFDGTRYVRDKNVMKRFELARKLCRDESNNQSDPKLKERLSSSKTIANLLALARSDSRIIVPAESWDADTGIINTPAGLVDLKTGQIGRGSADNLVTKLTMVAPTPGACPRWVKFLVEIFPGQPEVIDFMQVLLGYVLTGSITEQKIFFFFGKGSNGKSVLLSLVEWILGDYAMKLPANVLMQSRHSQHPTELAQLQGKRLAGSSELEDGQYWAEARLKELTGDDTLTARYMRGDFFTFNQTQKHLIAGNYRPKLKGGDEAIQRRMVLIPFKAKFEGTSRDDHLQDKLRGEAPQILHWLIQGAQRWYREGLQIPRAIAKESCEYMRVMDDIAEWMADCCEVGPNASQGTQRLYDSFSVWKKRRNEKPPSLIRWRERLLQQYPDITPGKRKKWGVPLDGLCLTNDEMRRLEGLIK
jgi:putative DNA primase/helicase